MDSNLGIINHKAVVIEKIFSMFCYTFQLKVFLTPISNADSWLPIIHLAITCVFLSSNGSCTLFWKYNLQEFYNGLKNIQYKQGFFFPKIDSKFLGQHEIPTPKVKNHFGMLGCTFTYLCPTFLGTCLNLTILYKPIPFFML